MEHVRGNSPVITFITKGQRDCQSQVSDLIERLTSWKDESHRQMSNILSSQSININKRFKDLVEEFSVMEVQISELRKERNVLLETIHDLNYEIKMMRARLPLTGTEEPSIKDGSLMDVIYIKEECLESPRINTTTDNEEENIDYQDSLYDKSPLHNSTSPVDYQAFDAFVDDSNLSPGKGVSKQDKEETQQNPIMKSSRRNMSKCMSSLSLHKKDVHNTNKIHVCEECGYASTKKYKVKEHWDSVHNKGEKKFKCEECPYLSARKSILRRHWDALHNKGKKRFKCEKCSYSSAEQAKLKQHMSSVHNMGLKFECDECGYASSRKDNIELHRKNVHKIEG